MFIAGMGGAELALARQAGLEPLGLVYGVVNRVSPSGGVSVIGEQRRSMQAQIDALHAALQRMNEQAHALGADGVAGVAIELRTQNAPGSEFMRLLECRAGGTAVRDAAAPARAPLWTATLSTQEIWALRQAGYTPKTVAVGFGAVFATGERWAMRRQLSGESARTLGQNIELSWMVEALQRTRTLAMTGVEADARSAGGAGNVGLQFGKRVHRPGSYGLLVEMQAIGTAIAPLARGAATAPAAVVADLAQPRASQPPTAAPAFQNPAAAT